MNLRSAFAKTASRKKFLVCPIASSANRPASRAASGVWSRRRQSCVGLICYADHLGTPRAITTSDASNTKVWEWKNDDPFGNNLPNEDPASTGTAFKYNNRFPGQYFDQETNTSYNYFRDYDPSIGRYVQSDPAGFSGGLNNFAYVGANPLSHSDHLGLWDDAGHRYFIDKAFDFYPTALRDQIDLGSRGTDGLLYQLPQYSPLHGMTSTSYPIKEKARKGYCETVEKNMRMFNLLKTSPNPTTRRMAFRFLGVAMHEVMDTTSPSHSDFQFWDMTDLNGIARHGDFGNSLETAAIAKNYLAETRQKMLDTFNNGKAPDCDCNK